MSGLRGVVGLIMKAAVPPISCAYPLAPNEALRVYSGSTVSLTGTGDGNRTVSWVSTGSGNSAIAANADALTTGSVLMGTDTVWYEAVFSSDGASYGGSLDGYITDGAGAIVDRGNNVTAPAPTTAAMVLTFGLNPDGTVVRKRNGVEYSPGSSGGPVTGQYFAPAIRFFGTNTGETVTATLRTSASEIQYAGAGVDLCGNAIP